MNNPAISYHDRAQAVNPVALQDLAAAYATLQQSVEELSQNMQALLQTAQEMLEGTTSERNRRDRRARQGMGGIYAEDFQVDGQRQQRWQQRTTQ
ncbi:hypothetical protein B0F90DRAFT_1816330 [Multifurca ochricompacta]|uniref:Uncharacterized protein n=1 Tax=Multifurca ochricompacta TaxID=376703 RepID=A0AAD4QPT7_9AGAM|nr:hypothetical protein B0F90DRAFT_1816330 [Multifurca ochricompacta]